MREVKVPGKLTYRFKKEDEEKFCNWEHPLCRVVENAGGVPFKLIFGSKPGEGYYVNIGKGITQLLGIPAEEFNEAVYNGIVEKVIPLSDDLPSDKTKAREKFIQGKISNYKAEVLIRTPDGERKWIQDTSLPLRENETGKVIGAYGILFDIDEGKKIQGSLETAMIKAAESDRLKSAFLTNLSHEIRTPLNAIVGFTTLLNEPDSDPDSKNEFMEIITRSTDHLLEIMDNIVEISNIEATAVKVSKEEIKLDLVIRKLYEQFLLKAHEKKITLFSRAQPEGNENFIRTDISKLVKVLTNLLNNAMKFTREGRVDFGYRRKGKMIEFFVSDTGIGISPEHHDRIFNRFYQADSSYTRRFEGTGLGLSISKAYVELLGGKIWFKSQPGEGSVFYFTIPVDRNQ
jgi:signal transduction histidine kinase